MEIVVTHKKGIEQEPYPDVYKIISLIYHMFVILV